MEIPTNEDPKLTPEQAAGLEMLMHRTIQLICAKGGFTETCLTCAHFTEETELCARWNARPPARTIVKACPEYRDFPLAQPF